MWLEIEKKDGEECKKEVAMKNIKLKIESINNNIEKLQSNINDLQQEKHFLENQLKNICEHGSAIVEHYVDYDRNKYMVICSECDKVLLNYDNVFKFRNFLEGYNGVLLNYDKK